MTQCSSLWCQSSTRPAPVYECGWSYLDVKPANASEQVLAPSASAPRHFRSRLTITRQLGPSRSTSALAIWRQSKASLTRNALMVTYSRIISGSRLPYILAKMSYIRTFALLAAALGNCASLRAQQADMVLIHGTVLTVDAKDTVAQALAIRRGEIVAVGTDAQIMKLAGKTTRIVDLHGRTATPGMIDTHSHYTEAGAEDLYFIKLNDATSVADIVARVKERVAVAKPGEWVRGRGWDEGKLSERRYIYAADLDAVSPNNPVLLTNTSGHYATVNSYVLRLAGIDDATRNPANGTIDRDAAGHITGVLKEGALAPIRALIPPFTAEQIKQGILKEIDDLHREGVTAFKDTATPAQWSALHALNDAGLLDERVCMLWRAGDSVDSARQTLAAIKAASPTPREYQHGRLAVCGTKIFMDGAAIAGTAWSYQPWFKNGVIDPRNTGYPNMDPEVYRQMVRLFHQAGISVGTHAIGDRAIDWVVDTYAIVEKESPSPACVTPSSMPISPRRTPWT